MPLTYSDYINALKANIRHPIIKLEFLNDNYQVTSSITPNVLDGTLSISSNESGSRRSCSLLLENTTGEYTPIPEGKLWANTKVRLYTGLKINNEDYLVSRGIFVVSQPEVNSLFSEKTVNINLMDSWSRIDGTLSGTLTNDTTIPLGTSIQTAVQSILTLAGETRPPIIGITNQTTPYTLVGEMGSTYSEMLLSLSQMLSWEVFFDQNGYLRFQSPVNEQIAAPIWDFSTDEVTYLTSSHKYDFTKIFNSIKIVGSNVNGSIVSAIAQDTNATSPTRVSLIGEKVKIIEDEVIPTNVLAQDRANYELKLAISKYESVDINCVPIDIINENSIITITDSSSDLSGDRHLVQSVNFPLGFGGEMTMSTWKIREI